MTRPVPWRRCPAEGAIAREVAKMKSLRVNHPAFRAGGRGRKLIPDILRWQVLKPCLMPHLTHRFKNCGTYGALHSKSVTSP